MKEWVVEHCYRGHSIHHHDGKPFSMRGEWQFLPTHLFNLSDALINIKLNMKSQQDQRESLEEESVLLFGPLNLDRLRNINMSYRLRNINTGDIIPGELIT